MSSASEGCMVDMWSLGVVTFFLLGGYFPFDDSDQKRLFRKIVAGKITFDDDKHWKHISADAKNFIEMLLTVNPKQRLTAQEALLHPWLYLDHVGTDHQLSDNLERLQKFNLKRKLRAAVYTVIATNKFTSLGFQFRMASAGLTDISNDI